MMKNTITIAECTSIEKAKVYTVAAITDYVSSSVAGTTVIKKITGDITVVSFDAGRGLAEKMSAFDIFVMIIEGKAEITINGKSNTVCSGQSIIVPANTRLIIQATERFKMVRTIIRSGYEQ